MAAEARIAALEGRLALVEESKRRLTEENTRLASNKAEDVHAQYQDLLSRSDLHCDQQDDYEGCYERW